MKKYALSLMGLALSGAAMPASAAVTVFNSTFEDVLTPAPSGPGYTFVTSADGWSATTENPIELQYNNVAGAPAPDGGNVFVELDSSQNSSMSRTIDAGTYVLSFLYSPRPGRSASDNPIEVLLGGTLLAPPGTVTAAGGGNTSWSTYTSNVFKVLGPTTLTFQAVGDSTSYGGYVDNINLTAVPEPATWGMMILGFGAIGGAMRGRRSAAKRAFA